MELFFVESNSKKYKCQVVYKNNEFVIGIHSKKYIDELDARIISSKLLGGFGSIRKIRILKKCVTVHMVASSEVTEEDVKSFVIERLTSKNNNRYDDLVRSLYESFNKVNTNRTTRI